MDYSLWMKRMVRELTCIFIVLGGFVVIGDEFNEVSPKEGQLSQAEEKQAEAAAWFATGLAFQMDGKAREAMEAFSNSANLDPTNLVLVEQVIPYLLSLKQHEKAIDILERALEAFPDKGSIQSLLGMSYIAGQKLEEALELNLSILEKNPDSISALRSVLAIYFQTGQMGEIAELMENVLTKESRNPIADLQLAEMLHSYKKSGQGERSQITNWLSQVLDLLRGSEVSSTQNKAKLAQLFEENGRIKRAISLYEEIIDLADLPPQVKTRLALLYLQSGILDKAKQLAGEIMEQEPLNPFGYRVAGYVEQESQDFEKAAKYFEESVKKAPKFQPSYFDLLTAYFNAQQNERARNLISMIKEKFEPSFQLYYYEGLLDYREENFEKALSAYEKALSVAEKSEPARLTPFFYFQLGIAYERVKKLDRCEVYFRKAIELRPDFAEAMNYLGYTWAENEIRLFEAQELIEQAVALDPSNAAYLDSLGWVYFKLDKLNKALRYQLKAIEFVDEPDPVMYEHLGDMYLHINKYQKAKQAYTKALQIAEKDEVRRSITGKINKIDEILDEIRNDS